MVISALVGSYGVIRVCVPAILTYMCCVYISMTRNERCYYAHAYTYRLNLSICCLFCFNFLYINIIYLFCFLQLCFSFHVDLTLAEGTGDTHTRTPCEHQAVLGRLAKRIPEIIICKQVDKLCAVFLRQVYSFLRRCPLFCNFLLSYKPACLRKLLLSVQASV